MKPSLKSQGGQALVEMAFLMLAFFFTIFGITEFARALYSYNVIVWSTREAARWGVVNITGSTDTTNINRAKNFVVYGDPDVSSGDARLNGLTTSVVNVSVQTVDVDDNGIPISQKVSVSVSGYQFQFIVPLVPHITIPAFETSLHTESMGSTG